MAPTTVRWGIMATGGIATNFVSDLLLSPKTRGVTDLTYLVTAVASSSSQKSATEFVTKHVSSIQSDHACAAYGSYQELVQDPNVDIVYIATPHSHHFQNCMLALAAGKHILCEKAFTVNAAQAKILYQTATAKNLFVMEGMWVRFFPLAAAVRDHVSSGAIGEVLRVTSDISIGCPPEETFEVGHRMVNPHLAGGALLDHGIYALTWIFQSIWHTLSPSLRQEGGPPKIVGTAMAMEPRTGVDEMSTILLEFPRSAPSGLTKAHAIATCAMRVQTDPDGKKTAGPAVRMYGTKGELQIYGPLHRPERIKLIPNAGLGEVQEKTFEFPGGGHGMFWEADAAARCVVQGKLECELIPQAESVLLMETMDEARRQVGLTYPPEIESVEWPLNLKAKPA